MYRGLFCLRVLRSGRSKAEIVFPRSRRDQIIRTKNCIQLIVKCTPSFVERTFFRQLSTSKQLETQPENLSAKQNLKKILELQKESEAKIAEKKFSEAIPLLEGAFDRVKKYSVDDELLIARLESLLAYAYQNTKRNEEAVSLYEKSVPILKKHLKDEKQIAALLMNMAEAYAAVKNITEAEKMAREALKIVRKLKKRDNEFTAAILTNLSAYLCAQRRFEEAKPLSAEALQLFRQELGKFNEYTKTAFTNYYAILKELKLEDEIKDLEADWETEEEIKPDETTLQFIEKIRKRFEQFSAFKKAEPEGMIKDPSFFREEMESFFKKWQEAGNNIDDPAFYDVIKQETDFASQGAKQLFKELQEELRKKKNEKMKESESNKENEKERKEIPKANTEDQTTNKQEKEEVKNNENEKNEKKTKGEQKEDEEEFPDFDSMNINPEDFIKSINDEDIANLLREINEIEPEIRKTSELASQPITNVPPDLVNMLREEMKESVELGIQDAEMELAQKEQELNEELKRQFERSKKKYTKGL